MFDSLAGGIVPVVVLALIAGSVSAACRQLSVAILLSVAAAVAIGFVWYYLPYLLWPATHTDPQGGWQFVAVAFWSLFAVPSALVALTAVRFLRGRNRGAW